jgi:hypothetical protein
MRGHRDTITGDEGMVLCDEDVTIRREDAIIGDEDAFTRGGDATVGGGDAATSDGDVPIGGHTTTLGGSGPNPRSRRAIVIEGDAVAVALHASTIFSRVIVGSCHVTISRPDNITSNSAPTITDARANSGTLDAIAPARPACGHGVRRSVEYFTKD